MTNIKLMTHSVLFAVIVLCGFAFMQVYEEHQKNVKEIEVLKEQKETTIKEREKYELQIEYLRTQIKTEKERLQAYKELRK